MNVIVILMDTLRRDYLGAYGNTWVKTPALDDFARGSTQFTNSYMASYPCMPARQDLWTGRCNFFWRGWSPMEYTDRDLVRVMREQGRVTQMITDHYHYWQWGGGNYHMNFDGVEMIRGQEGDNWITDSSIEVAYPAPPERLRAGFDIYYKNTAHFKSEEDFFGPAVFRAAGRWVEHNHDRPFFLMIDSFDPHEPWHTPDEYWRMYDPDYAGDHLVWPPYGTADRFDEKELHHIRSCYAGEVTLSDKYFGEFMGRLERLGLLENTMVVVTADHGYLFGEHNWVGKHSSTLYNQIAQTPLLVYHPQQAEPGRQVHHLVQMPDLYATILEAVGADTGDVHGRSLLPLMLDGGTGEPIHEVACFGMHGEQLHVTDGEWVYVRRPQKAGPLYWYTGSHFFDATWPGSAKPYRYMDLESTRRRAAQFDGQRFPVREDNPSFVPQPDELYHLPTDPEQNRNVAVEQPHVCERLRAAAGRYMKQIGVPAEQFARLGISDE